MPRTAPNRPHLYLVAQSPKVAEPAQEIDDSFYEAKAMNRLFVSKVLLGLQLPGIGITIAEALVEIKAHIATGSLGDPSRCFKISNALTLIGFLERESEPEEMLKTTAYLVLARPKKLLKAYPELMMHKEELTTQDVYLA